MSSDAKESQDDAQTDQKLDDLGGKLERQASIAAQNSAGADKGGFGLPAASVRHRSAKDAYSLEEIKEHFEKIRSAFRIFDSDGTGQIELDEVSSILDLVATGMVSQSQLESVARELGMDENGKVSEDAFVAAFADFARGVDDKDDSRVLKRAYDSIQDGEVERLKIAFQACDTDGSGEIDKEELGLIMKTLGENPSEKALDKMYRELDADGDGGVDFDEFIKFMCARKKAGKGKVFNVDALTVVSSFMADKQISTEESDALMEKMPVLERLGAGYVKSSHRTRQLKEARKKKGAKDDDEEERRAVHILTKEERKTMKFVERTTYYWVGFFGWVSGVLAGAAEVIAVDQWNVDGFEDVNKARVSDDSLTTRVLYYWLLVGGISVGATLIEVLLIYFAHLKAAVKISSIAGLKLFPIDNERAFVTAALARAALELPNPQEAHMGVDPLEEASKARLFFAALMYKAKTGLTTFVIRLFFKRVVARVAVKAQSFVPFVGTLVNMFWNVAIAFKCLRQARVVALGPSVAVEVFNGLMDSYPSRPIPYAVKEGVLRSVAVTIVTNEEMHPNLRVLLQHAQTSLGLKLGEPEYIEVDDSDDSQADDKAALVKPSIQEEESKEDDKVTVKLDGKSDPNSVEMTAVKKDDASSNGGAPKVENVANVDNGAAGRRRTTVLAPGFDHPPVERPGNHARFMAAFDSFNQADRRFVLQTFALALIMDGFVEKSSIKMYSELSIKAGYDEVDCRWPLKWLTDVFVRGELDHQYIIELFKYAADAYPKSRTPEARCRRCCEGCMMFFSC